MVGIFYTKRIVGKVLKIRVTQVNKGRVKDKCDKLAQVNEGRVKDKCAKLTQVNEGRVQVICKLLTQVKRQGTGKGCSPGSTRTGYTLQLTRPVSRSWKVLKRMIQVLQPRKTNGETEEISFFSRIWKQRTRYGKIPVFERKRTTQETSFSSRTRGGAT